MLLWHDVCWSCSLTDGAGIGCYAMMSAGLTDGAGIGFYGMMSAGLTDSAGIGCYGMMTAGLVVLQMALVLAVMA